MKDRLADERHFHDAEASRRAITFDREPVRLRFRDSEYLDHEPWVRYAFGQLGHLDGRRILDLGCGHGMAAVVMARHGANVTACDISPGYVQEVCRRAKANEAIIDVRVADAERLPFDDEAFDAVWGHAILHHLDVLTAAREVRRVLRPGGVAVFSEPWAGNPLIQAARRLRRHTKNERALRNRDLDFFRSIFWWFECRGFQLTGIRRAPIQWIEERLFSIAPFIQSLSRYVVLTVR